MKPETVFREISKGSARFLAATSAVSMILIGRHPDNGPEAAILLVGVNPQLDFDLADAVRVNEKITMADMAREEGQ